MLQLLQVVWEKNKGGTILGKTKKRKTQIERKGRGTGVHGALPNTPERFKERHARRESTVARTIPDFGSRTTMGR